MTSTTRLDALERALPPLEAVLVWLEEAHTHESVGDYVRAMVDLPDEQHPFTVIVGRVEAWVRVRYRDHDEAQVKTAVDEAVRDAVFRYHLALAIETAAATFAGRFDAVMLLALRQLADEVEGCRADAEAGRACGRQVHHGRANALKLFFRYELEDAALVLAEERYLNDRDACYAETDDAWDRLERWVDLIMGMLWYAPDCTGAGEPPADVDEGDDAAPVPEPIESDDQLERRVGELVDEALVKTHESFGEGAEARELSRRMITGRSREGETD